MRTVVSVGVVVFSLAVSTVGQAQFNHYHLPMEKGSLESHVDLQLHYSNLDFGNNDANIVVLGIEAQYAFADRVEAGLNIPFMWYSWAEFGSRNSDDVQFGDIVLGLKFKIFGIGDYLSIAAFLNTRLPTHSADYTRDYAFLTQGVAVSGEARGAMYGMSLNSLWFINGRGEDVATIGIDFFGGYTVLDVLTFKLGIQFANSIYPEDTLSPFAVVPGVEVRFLSIAHLGIAARIALNDEGELWYLGRASVLFHLGLDL